MPTRCNRRGSGVFFLKPLQIYQIRTTKKGIIKYLAETRDNSCASILFDSYRSFSFFSFSPSLGFVLIQSPKRINRIWFFVVALVCVLGSAGYGSLCLLFLFSCFCCSSFSRSNVNWVRQVVEQVKGRFMQGGGHSNIHTNPHTRSNASVLRLNLLYHQHRFLSSRECPPNH